MLSPADLLKLKTELTTDPMTIPRGYASMDDVDVAKSLAVRDRETDNETFTGGELLACIDLTEWAALLPTTREYLAAAISAATIPNTPNARNTLRNIFATGSNSKPRIAAMLRRVATRAEELGLPRITESDVADARRI